MMNDIEPASAYDAWYAQTFAEGVQRGIVGTTAENLEPAYTEWYAQTFAEGVQVGIAQGMAQGKIAHNLKGRHFQSIKIARRMLNKNISLEEIAELTDLTLTQIITLQAENR